MVAEAVLLPKVQGKRLYDLRRLQVQNPGDQKPGTLVAGHLDDEDVHRELGPAHRSEASQLFGAELAPSTVSPSLALSLI